MNADETTKKKILDLYGAHYFHTDTPHVYESPEGESYHFVCYIGTHQFELQRGDCCYVIADSRRSPPSAQLVRGPSIVRSEQLATVIRGFKPPSATCDLRGRTVLPYVNGCSTKQVFPPPRPGDPTLQFLTIPPHSAEQAHHIHATVRVVYVLSGRGVSVVGMEKKVAKEDLLPGTVCILEPMCPHHFETPYGEHLTAIPLHVWSSVPGVETNHPMFVGTYMMNQGA